uniref:Uncharacterized protein n=1 Tax=Rhizophora mucronata TaxID=61149 RepID=A0A2P2NL99_RHIMU
MKRIGHSFCPIIIPLGGKGANHKEHHKGITFLFIGDKSHDPNAKRWVLGSIVPKTNHPHKTKHIGCLVNRRSKTE